MSHRFPARIDAAGYIREWVPELARPGDDSIHDPAVRPEGYPKRIIDHAEARARELADYTMGR